MAEATAEMSSDFLDDLLSLATRLAREAAELSLPLAGRTPAQRKADKSVVTATDHAIQERILTTIAQTYPDHAVIAEETLHSPTAHADRGSARYCWVVDPLDGTRNFIAGFPCFSTSIAVLDRGHPVIGVVFEHNLRQMYTAVRGRSAWLGQRVLQVQKPSTDEDILVGVPGAKDELSVRVVQTLTATKGIICRNLGSAAFHLAMTSSGALTAAFCKQCKIWDIAAGVLIATSAGAVATDPWGHEILPFPLGAPSEDRPVLVGPPAVHHKLLEIIKTL